MPKGGRQPGSGRPKGVLNKTTIETKTKYEELRRRILRSIDKLLNSQMNLARGVQYLFKINKDRKVEIVRDANVIEAFLAGELDNSRDELYYITTEKPDEKALEYLFNRVFGMPQMKLDATSMGKALPTTLQLILTEDGNANDKSNSQAETGLEEVIR